MRDIYKDGTYLKNHPNWHVEDSPWKADKVIRAINRNNLNPLTICEVGCGAGGVLHQLSTQLGAEKQFFGYEISPQAYAIAKTKSDKNLRFFLQDLFEVDDAFFDLVLAIDVIEHVEDYFGFLRNLKNKGTYKIFHIPLDLSARSVARGLELMDKRKAVGHLHYFIKDTALRTLEDTGYEIIDFFYTCDSIELPLRTQSYKAVTLRFLRKTLFRLHEDLTARLLGGFPLMVLAK